MRSNELNTVALEYKCYYVNHIKVSLQMCKVLSIGTDPLNDRQMGVWSSRQTRRPTKKPGDRPTDRRTSLHGLSLQKFTIVLMSKKFPALIQPLYKIQPLDCILRQFHPVYTLTSGFLNIHYNITTPSTPGTITRLLLSARFPKKNVSRMFFFVCVEVSNFSARSEILLSRLKKIHFCSEVALNANYVNIFNCHTHELESKYLWVLITKNELP